MLFAKQKALIGLLFLSMPFVAVFAFLDTPVVSGIALEFALKFARFRTGLRLETKTWTVRPLSFSAALEEVLVGIDGFNLRAQSVSVQLSPLSVLVGRIDLREVRIDAPVMYGRIPPRWLESDSSAPSPDFSQMDVPSWVGNRLAKVMEHFKGHRLNFDRLKIRDGKSEAKDAQIGKFDLEVSNLDGGQVRAEWDFQDLSVPGKIQPIRRFEGSVGVLNERRNQFFLAVRKLNLQIADPIVESAPVLNLELSGRWPGEINGRLDVKVAELDAWARKSSRLKAHWPGLAMSGKVHSEFEAGIRKNKLDTLTGTLNTRSFQIDGYYPNDVDASFKKTSQGWEIAQLKIGLPHAPESDPQGTIRSPKIVIEENKISGELTLAKAGLCAILIASDAPDCYVGIGVDGVIPFEGTLEPFLLKAKPVLNGTRGDVLTEPYVAGDKNKQDPLVTLKPVTLKGDVLVEDKFLRLSQITLDWADGSQLRTDGKIVYKPTQVDLTASARGSQLESLLEHFMNLQVKGAARIEARILYNKDIPREKGRTKIFGSTAIEKFGLSGQTFGTLSGPVEYARRELKIGPLKLLNGGGKGVISGLLQETPEGSRIRLNGNFDRLEVDARLPESGRPMFHGFMSGTASLEGFTDYSKHPKEFLSGPIDVEVDTLNAFGIPFQSAVGHAVYTGRVLEIRSFRARKGTGQVEMSGRLHPDSGTELRFSSTDVQVKTLGWGPHLDLFQEGTMRVEEGFWAPAKGWKVVNKLKGLRIAGRRLTNGTLSLMGDAQSFKIEADLPGQIKVFSESNTEGNVSRMKRIRAEVRNEGFYGLFAWLKKWNTENPVSGRGDLVIDWTPEKGTVKTSGLQISGPQGIDGRPSVLMEISQPKEFSWEGNKVVKNDMNFQGPTTLSLSGAVGAKEVAISADLPGALIDLFVPAFKIRGGRIALSGHLPLPPDLDSFVAYPKVQDLILSFPGIGQPITRLSGDLEMSQRRLLFKSLKGQLGGGGVSASGAYRLDLDRPGLYLDANLNRAQTVILDDIVVEATGDLSLRGEQLPYLLTGTVLVTNALYTKEFNEKTDPLEEVESDPVLRFGMNVEIGANCRVRNSASSGVLTGKLVVGGTDRKPEIAGNIDILSGSVFAKDTEFRVSQGKVTFPGGSTKIPVVNLLATTTIKQPSQDYRIQLQARGPADQLSLDLTSDPSLPPGDIVNLLAFGVLRPANDLEAARAEALQVLFGGFFGSNFSKATGFNVRFEAASDLAQEKTIPKVTAVRKISDKVTATVGRSLDLNPETNVQVDYKLLRNVNLTGVWERKDQSNQQEQSSTGVDLRFKFDLK